MKYPMSVVVPTRNRAASLAALLEALVAQRYPAYEIIVVDDASTDETPELLRRWQGEGRRVIRLDRPAGSYAARNAGWQAATGEIVAFTDDDCLPDPGWLAGLAAALGSATGVQGATLARRPAGTAEITPFTHQIEQTRPGPPYRTCNIAYRREVLARLGGFDGRLRWYADNILGLRVEEEARSTGRPQAIAFAPAAIVYHPPRPREYRDRGAWRARFAADEAHRAVLRRLAGEPPVPRLALPVILWIVRPLLRQGGAHLRYALRHPGAYLRQIRPMLWEKRELLAALWAYRAERGREALGQAGERLPALPAAPLISVVIVTRGSEEDGLSRCGADLSVAPLSVAGTRPQPRYDAPQKTVATSRSNAGIGLRRKGGFFTALLSRCGANLSASPPSVAGTRPQPRYDAPQKTVATSRSNAGIGLRRKGAFFAALLSRCGAIPATEGGATEKAAPEGRGYEKTVVAPRGETDLTSGLSLLADTLGALGRQTWPRREVIVVEHGGEGQTRAVAAAAGARWIAVPHATLGGARQAGVQAATGDIVAFTDDDCLPDPGWLAALAGALRDERLWGVQGRTEPERGPIGAHAIQIRHGSALYETCNIAYRRAALQRAGGFDAGFVGWFEDTALGARVLAQGGTIGFAPDAVVTHRAVPPRRRDRPTWRAILHDEQRLALTYPRFYRRTRAPGWPAAVLGRWLVGSALKEALRELPRAPREPAAYARLLTRLLKDRVALVGALAEMRSEK